jgi:hypothetical protein
MSKTERLKRPMFWLATITIVIFAVAMQRLNTKARMVESELVAELEMAKPPTLSQTKVYEKRLHKPGVAYVRTQFSSSAGADDIVGAYRTHLEKRGWTFFERRDYPPNIEALEFCKGSYAAILELQTTHSPQIISFRMNWGLNDCSSFKPTHQR